MSITTKSLLLFFAVLIAVAGVLILRKTKDVPPKVSIKTNSETVIQQIRKLNRLETASYTIEKVIDAGTSGGKFEQFLFGDRILLIAHGDVIAGFDLAKLQESDVHVEDKAISLTLPAPEILSASLNTDQTRVYDRQTGLLSKGDKDLESEARQAAEQTIKEAACKGNILQTASDNARKQLTAFLKALQFTSVVISIPSGSC